jgi:hypothetical protein
MTITVPWNASWTGDLDTCPTCHGAGYTKAPYLMGLETGDLFTITACRCPAGEAFKAQVAAMAVPMEERE